MRRLAALLAVAAIAAAEDDAVLVAARRALAAGEPGQALALVGDDAARPGERALIAARCRLALGDLAATRAAIGDPQRWPTASRGSARLVLAEAAVADGDDAAALAGLRAALADGPAPADLDRALALFAETAWRAGARDEAVKAAGIIWRRPTSHSRGAAGIVLARAAIAEEPSRAREHLAAVLALDGLAAGERRTATELLCRALLRDHPGACLVAAERGLAEAGDARGALPLWRALALARLDPREGARALAELPAALADEPAARAEAARVAAALAAGGGADRAQRLERGLADAELGRWESARALLEPLADEEPTALGALARAPGFDPRRWLDRPAAADPVAAIALGRALIDAGDPLAAWPPLRAAAERAPEAWRAAAWYWAAIAAATAAPDAVAGLRARLLGLDVHTVETGLAWADEARRREAAGEATAVAAWTRAAADLPAGHAWKAAAAWRAARGLLLNDDAAGAVAAVLPFAGAGEGDDADRCRFLLVQAWERTGNCVEALELLRRLRPRASAEQRARLDAIALRLEKPAARPATTP